MLPANGGMSSPTFRAVGLSSVSRGVSWWANTRYRKRLSLDGKRCEAGAPRAIATSPRVTVKKWTEGDGLYPQCNLEREDAFHHF